MTCSDTVRRTDVLAVLYPLRHRVGNSYRLDHFSMPGTGGMLGCDNDRSMHLILLRAGLFTVVSNSDADSIRYNFTECPAIPTTCARQFRRPPKRLSHHLYDRVPRFASRTNASDKNMSAPPPAFVSRE